MLRVQALIARVVEPTANVWTKVLLAPVGSRLRIETEDRNADAACFRVSIRAPII